MHPYIRSKPLNFFPMTSDVPRRHPVTSESRATWKYESVYYNLQFWLFLGHFWTPLGLVILSPKTFLGKPMCLITLRGCVGPFVLPRKSLWTPHLFISRKTKIASKWTQRHPDIHYKPHDSFPMTSHVPSRQPVTFRARVRGKFESMYYNLHL